MFCRYFSLLLVLAGMVFSPCAAWSRSPPGGGETLGPEPPALPAPATLRQWVVEMKDAPRGPFKRIRWFCNDGAILPPRPYACGEHGGGVQHGEYSERTATLRMHGYFVANVLADLIPRDFLARPQADTLLKQILLEQFLIEADDGWIFRRARFYRGALQAENETAQGRALLLELVKDRNWRRDNYLVLREAVRFLPHGREGAPFTEMRQLARTIGEQDPVFDSLKVKLHVRPEATDAEAVRRHAAEKGRSELAAEYAQLARLIEDVYRPRSLAAELLHLAGRVRDRSLADSLREKAAALEPGASPRLRHAAASRLLAVMRERLGEAGSAERMLTVLDASLDLEQEVFHSGNAWLSEFAGADRGERLAWLQDSHSALFGIGLISARQRQALGESVQRLTRGDPPLGLYREELAYLARAPAWADDALYFHFGATVDHLAILEPLVRLYSQDRLRGSPLVAAATVLDTLMVDADRLLGVPHDIFGTTAGSGVRALNPGLARGELRVLRPGARAEGLDRNAIYLLPETLADLSPVAGIITRGAGNSLSHVQLLARNLGIPNIVVDERLAADIEAWLGRPVVLAVSSGGAVVLAADGPRWQAVFPRREAPREILIRPDLEKLDLGVTDFIPLDRLRAGDSGRVVGPKGANLGELKAHFPELVPEGLALPFGLFRRHLAQPIAPGGPPVFAWLAEQYALLANIADERSREQAAAAFLQRLRTWIETSEPGRDFRVRLAAAMSAAFGADGSYGVFVRSDTNVEDLPGFTGAGLNRTVPHVVGFDNVVAAILEVWASPFSERAYRWRQAHMERPEQVYASVLLLESVAADKSGVLVTKDAIHDRAGWLTAAVSEGVGGAVEGQRAEELLIARDGRRVRLLAQASEPFRRALDPTGGVVRVAAAGPEVLLAAEEIAILAAMAQAIPERFPALHDGEGRPAPADIEFGFAAGRFVLFQIRPYLESRRARQDAFLARLDAGREGNAERTVALDRPPQGEIR